MLVAGVGLSKQHDTEQATREAAQAALSQAGGDRADFALVFASAHHGAGYGRVLRTVRAETQASQVVGCSAGGVLTTAGEVERAPGVAVLTVRSDTLSAHRFFVPQLRGRARTVGQEVVSSVTPHLGPENLALVFPDTYNFDSPAFFDGITEGGLSDVPFVGGGASEDGSVGETFQLCGDTVSSDAVSGALLSGQFTYTIGITQACQPVSPVHQVTKAHNNLILELDGRPAFEVFAERVSPQLRDDLRRAAAYIFVGLPVDAKRQHIAPGEYVVRNLVGFDPERGIIAVADQIVEGQKLVFTLRDGNGARTDLKRELEAQDRSWQHSRPAFGLYFNCVGRGSGLYGIPDIDSSYINQYLADVPVIGFFTGCEIAPVQRQAIVHQYSGVLVLVGEKPLH